MSNIVNFPAPPAPPASGNSDHERFDRLYGEWLGSCGQAIAPAQGVTIDDEIRADQRRDELVLLLAGAAAPLPALIVRKLELLERVLENRQHAEDSDRVEFLIVAGIRADLLRLAS